MHPPQRRRVITAGLDLAKLRCGAHLLCDKYTQRLQATGESLQGSWFYSDSHNDIPLLQEVDNPVVVDPDPRLRAHGEERGWPIISLR